MPVGFFYKLGNLIYQLRWFAILLWVALFIACLPILPQLTDPFKAIGFKDPDSESAKASQLLNDKLGYSYNRFIVMYTSKQSFTENSLGLKEIKNSLANLKKFPIEHQVILPDTNNKQISRDKHAAYAIILFNSDKEIEPASIEKFQSLIKPPPHLVMKIGGEPIFMQDTKIQTQRDMYKTEFIVTPIAILTMLLVFGSVIAAILPTILGGMSALFILTLLFLLGHYFNLSVFTLNIALLLGLCLSLDYSLLIISRYKDELNKGLSIEDAIAVTQATAGKAVFFSGLVVLISLSALLLFKVNVLFSVGMGGVVAVLVSMAVAVILLPAVLSVLKHNINMLPIRLFRKKVGKTYWHWSVIQVVRRPLLFFVTILMLLLALGYPVIHAKVGISDFRILPKGLESRDVFDIFKKKFGENKLDPIYVLIQSKDKNILTKKNLGKLYDLSDRIKKDRNVKEIISIVSTTPRMTKQQYQMMYTDGKDQLPDALKSYLKTSTKNNLTVMTIISKTAANSPETKKLVENLFALNPGKNFTMQVTGGSVNTIDVKNSISKTFPYAFLWIVGFTYLILLLFLRSIILPFKAIFTTILSLCASYGMLVLVFQDGYLHHLLNFEPQGILDVSLLIIIFCALFGVSMDYEVFLLTRIKEYYEKTHNNIESIVSGIERSSKIITSAAVIVIFICFSFMAADVLIVKAFGLGIAVAVFVDAFIIRTLFVPAAMTLLGKLNWYVPEWLNKILPEVSFDPDHFPVHAKPNHVKKHLPVE